MEEVGRLDRGDRLFDWVVKCSLCMSVLHLITVSGGSTPHDLSHRV